MNYKENHPRQGKGSCRAPGPPCVPGSYHSDSLTQQVKCILVQVVCTTWVHRSVQGGWLLAVVPVTAQQQRSITACYRNQRGRHASE